MSENQSTAGMIHIGKNGPGECRARVRKCQYIEDGHYNTMAEAEVVYRKQQEEEENRTKEEAGGNFGRLKEEDGAEETPAPEPKETPEIKKKTLPDVPKKESVRYSFLKDFKKQDEQFETDFEGFPKRFFNSDLRGKLVNPSLDVNETVKIIEDEGYTSGVAYKFYRRIANRKLAARLLHSVSSPADNQISDEDVETLLSKVEGAKSIRKIDDGDRLLDVVNKGAQRGWVMEFDVVEPVTGPSTRYMVITDKPAGRGNAFRLTRPIGGIPRSKQVTLSDIRSLAGAARLQRKTGEENMLVTLGSESVQQHNSPSNYQALKALQTLEDAQLEGQNFLANRKYVKDNSGKIATAFDDKKHADKTRQEMMKSTTLAAANGGDFRKVEIDNDVDPEEYKNFEKAYHEISDKLPKTMKEKMPELRIRKLGKHGSANTTVNGLFNPARNTVVMDVRTSEAFIHEMGHHYDLVAQNNASVSAEFKEISRGYSAGLKETDPKRRQYLNTPTEVFARLTERYAHERLGIDNRLLNPDKFTNDDYTAFDNTPGLKEKGFALLDKLFADEEKKS